MSLLWKDIRYSIHSLRANPGFALVSILTLALGIGATTAIFSVVNGVLLRPLPLRDPSRLVMVWETSDSNLQNVVSPANYTDWTKLATGVFSSMGCSLDWKLTLTGRGEPEEILTGLADNTFFPTLGADPYIGRVIGAKDIDTFDREQYAVLSYALWQRKFGGDPKVIGKTIRIDNSPLTIVGVMPREFFVPRSGAQLWIPYRLPTKEGENRGRYLAPIARLAPGVTVQQAQARMTVIAEQLALANPRHNKDHGANVLPVYEQVVGNVRRALLIVLAAVVLLLLIACVNIANLLLSRATSRSKEMAIRSALGASRARLIAQSLTESVVLALIAAVLGVVIAGWATMILVRFTPESASPPRMAEVAVDGRVLAVTMFLTVTTALLFGLAPAIEGSRPDLQTGLKTSGRGSTQDRRGKMFRNALVITEVALATVLLIGAGLMIKSFSKLQGVDSGVKAGNVLTMHLVLPRSYETPESKNAIVAQMIERVRSVPGVNRIGVINNMPFTNWVSRSSFVVEGEPLPKEGDEPSADFRTSDGGYFAAIGLPLVAGRVFEGGDHAKAPTVFVVNDVFARRFFPGESAVGRRLAFEWFGDVSGEIIGVVGSYRQDGLENDAKPAIYRNFAQDPSRQFTLVAGTSVDPQSVQVPITQVIHKLDPMMPVSNVTTLESLISGTIARPRFNATMLSIFAGLGLLLASIGIYGVLSYSVAQRTHEMGIRMALGADPGDVLRLVVRDGAVVGAIGVVVGLVVAFPSARVLASLLYGVEASDPAVFVGVAAALTAVALAASYIPARRATRVDPMIALRPE